MPQSAEFQPLAQQQPANQFLQRPSAIAKSDQPVYKVESATSTLLPLIDPTTLVQYGGVTVAVILSITCLILALAEYNKVFLPVMLGKSGKKPHSRVSETCRRVSKTRS